MTSPRRSKKYGQCIIQQVDWDSPSTETGTVKRRSSCPENSTRTTIKAHDVIVETSTPSDTSSGTSKSLNGDDKTASLVEIEQRISCIINENRTSQSNSESDIDILIESILDDSSECNLVGSQHGVTKCDRSKTFIKSQDVVSTKEKTQITKNEDISIPKKIKERKLNAPLSIKKINKAADIVRRSSLTRETVKTDSKSSVLPIYKATVQSRNLDLGEDKQKNKVISKLKLPFSPAKAMDKPKIHFLHERANIKETKPPSLLASPVRRTISNEYVRLKFTNDTVMRRTIDGKSIPKITPKIQSIIPESPIDSEDPFLNLSPNKKYTVTVNNKVRCDKDNYVIFDPKTGFNPTQTLKTSRIPAKSAPTEKSKIPLKSPPGEHSASVSKFTSASDTDSGILSPNSPSEVKKSAHYVNAAVFSEAAKKSAADLDITIVDPSVAKKATDQIKVALLPKLFMSLPLIKLFTRCITPHYRIIRKQSCS
ncbi:unnamed protein product [Colias eurytheme]|nr:unnamed protein product [Colias eurytheme]